MAATKTPKNSRQRTARRDPSGQRRATGEPAAKTTRRNRETRDAGRRVVKAYESTWDKVADFQDTVADKSRVDWLADLARAQARITRKISSAYGAEARKLIG